ncbi:MAG TPA: DnaJ domain-containing protein [Polyangiaceae bacterium]|nr:DnaJ domain-containing protein [Polyangiaceae bacterium]
MNSRAGSQTPHPVAGVNIRSLPIGPEEAFVLSRIDGRTSEPDLAAATGLPPERIARCLARLAELGAIQFDRAPEPARPTRERMNAVTIDPEQRPAIEPPPGPAREETAALYDPSELDEAVDLDRARKRRVLDLYYRLDGLDHYAALGVARDADKKAIKNAYYEAVSVFHPDRYFGKNLGSFKPKLERIFTRLTEAHDVLSRSRSRTEYDAYLSTQKTTRDLEQLMTDRARQLEEVRREIEREARLAERAAQAQVQRPPTFSSAPPRAPDPEARRKALARKLGVSLAPPARASSPAPAAGTSRDHAVADLKRRYEERVLQVKARQIDHYLERAEEALGQGNAVSAANALRIAATLAPENTDIVERLGRVERQANDQLSASYLKTADYELKSGRLADAARSYQLAARGSDDPRVFERAAFCLLESGGDLRAAAEHGKKAVLLAPEDAGCRLTLARVYLAAGMQRSAVGEIQRATELAPNDDTIRDWAKRIRRGEA